MFRDRKLIIRWSLVRVQPAPQHKPAGRAVVWAAGRLLVDPSFQRRDPLMTHPRAYVPISLNRCVRDFSNKQLAVRQDVAPAQAVKTLIHELGHALVHADELPR